MPVTGVCTAPEAAPATGPYPEFETELKTFLGLLQARDAVARAVKKRPHNIRQFILKTFETKRALGAALGLGPDLRHTFTVDAQEAITNNPYFKTFQRFVQASIPPEQLADETGRDLAAMITENKILIAKREYRFSRYVNRLFSETNFYHWAARNLNGLPATHARWDRFCPQLFDAAATNRRKVVISANPMDILLSAEQSGFTSCHSWAGCHANGNVAYCKDEQTAIVFLRQEAPAAFPFFKVNRMFLYVDPKSKLMFTLGRAYGNLDEFLQKQISSTISSRLAESQKVDNQWYFKSDFTYPSNNIQGAGHANNDHARRAIYFDLAVTRFVYHSTHKKGKLQLAEIVPSFTFQKATCLSCGTETEHGHALACRDCRANGGYDYRCGHCGYGGDVAGQFRAIGAVQVCNNCFNTHYITCRDCQTVRLDRGHIRINGDKICQECRDANYFMCTVSKEWAHNKFGTTAFNLSGKPVLIRRKFKDKLGEGLFLTEEDAAKARRIVEEEKRKEKERLEQEQRERQKKIDDLFDRYSNTKDQLYEALNNRNFDRFADLFKDTFGNAPGSAPF